MPTYEYVCRHCGHRFEAWQHMTDDPLTVCPRCGDAIHRVLFPAGIVFKGSGFYKTEYGSSSGGASKNGAESKTKAGESTGSSERSASESASSSKAPASAAAD